MLPWSLPFQLSLGKGLGHQDSFTDEDGNAETEEKNAGDDTHGLAFFLGGDPSSDDANPHPDPQAENARHPDTYKESVFVTNKKPERNTRQKANEGTD